MLTVKQLRLISEKSQISMAKSLGVNVKTYQKWERDPGKFPVSKAILFTELCNCDFNSDIFLPSNATKVNTEE